MCAPKFSGFEDMLQNSVLFMLQIFYGAAAALRGNRRASCPLDERTLPLGLPAGAP